LNKKKNNEKTETDSEIKAEETVSAVDQNPEGAPEAETDDSEHAVKSLFESLLFISGDPLPISFFVKNFSIEATQAKIVLDSLMDEFDERDGGIRLVEVSNGFQFVTSPRYAQQIRRALGMKKREGLTKGMLETLAIVSYKQPIVLAEIDDLRGVSSRMMIANLMKKNLVRPVGRKELPGRPLAYGTTDEFLKYFGLNKISDLPKLSEIKEFSLDSEE
jgi:segregation and condensation protein B